jgi:hypothetical protein
MESKSALYVGHTNTRAAHVLRQWPSVLSRFRRVLVTVIDSCEDVAGLWRQSPALRGLAVDFKVLDKGVVMPARDILSLADPRVSNGFDEYWFFLDEPVVCKPANCRLNCPPGYPDDLELIIPWFTQSNCELGIGDGIGLDYIARSQTDARTIEELAGE